MCHSYVNVVLSNSTIFALFGLFFTYCIIWAIYVLFMLLALYLG